MGEEMRRLVERVARLEAWANDFSCRAEHSDAPIFVTKEQEDEDNRRTAALRLRTQAQSSTSTKGDRDA